MRRLMTRRMALSTGAAAPRKPEPDHCGVGETMTVLQEVVEVRAILPAVRPRHSSRRAVITSSTRARFEQPPRAVEPAGALRRAPAAQLDRVGELLGGMIEVDQPQHLCRREPERGDERGRRRQIQGAPSAMKSTLSAALRPICRAYDNSRTQRPARPRQGRVVRGPPPTRRRSAGRGGPGCAADMRAVAHLDVEAAHHGPHRGKVFVRLRRRAAHVDRAAAVRTPRRRRRRQGLVDVRRALPASLPSIARTGPSAGRPPRPCGRFLAKGAACRRPPGARSPTAVFRCSFSCSSRSIRRCRRPFSVGTVLTASP